MELLKRYKGSKSDKELLSFSIGVKCLYSNSVLIPSIHKVMLIFGIGFSKAKSLIERAKTSELFRYDSSKNILIAKTYKDNSTKFSRNGRKYKSDFCYKIIKSKKSLAYLVKEINNALLLNAINGEERNNLTQRLGKPEKRHRCVQHSPITTQKFANIAGLTRSTAYRMLHDLYEKERVLDKTSKHMEMVIPVVNDETVQEWSKRTGKKNFIYNPNDGSGWIVVPTSYSIRKRSATERFKHVIYTHKVRVHASCKAVKPKYDDPFDNPIMGAYF